MADWQPIETAPKDTPVLAIVGKGASERPEWWGRIFQIRHEGKTPSGYDLGWSLFPGWGGCGDFWFDGWMPLPPPPETPKPAHAEGGA